MKNALPRGRPPKIPRTPEEEHFLREERQASLDRAAIDDSAAWRDYVVERRPADDWYTVAYRINEMHRCNPRLSVDSVIRICKRLVGLGLLPPRILDKSVARISAPTATHAAAVRIRAEHPGMTLQEIGRQLLREGHSPIRSTRWNAASIRRLLNRRSSGSDQD